MKILKIFLGSIFFITSLTNAEEIKIRIGHFPNLPHAQSLLAHQMTRQGRGWFEPRLEKFLLKEDLESKPVKIKIDWYVYNAGPSAMEALFANAIDLSYCGPNPAINAYLKSNRENPRIIAAAAYGGASLVLREDLNILDIKDFKGKIIATPQLGNTQDISARAWFISQGFKITQRRI